MGRKPGLEDLQVGLLLFAMFVVVPVLEIATFIQVNSLVGLLPTLAGIVLTAVVGAWLVRQQGFSVMRDAQAASQRNELPVEPIMHGVMILAAGLMLITPGFITDTFGFLLLVPPVRRLIMRHGQSWLASRVSVATYSSDGPAAGQGPVIDGEAVDISDRGGAPDPKSPWIKNRPNE